MNLKHIFILSLIVFSNIVKAQTNDSIIFNTQWSNTFPSSVGSSFLSGICNSSNGVISSGAFYNSLSDQYTLNIDSNGNKIWSAQRIPGGDHDGWSDVDELDNGNFICYGQQNGLGTSYFDAAWVVYNPLGVEISSGFFPVSGSSRGAYLKKLSTGNLIMSGPQPGGAFVYLTNQNMNILNSVSISMPGWNTDLVLENNNDIFIIGSDGSASTISIYKYTNSLVSQGSFILNNSNGIIAQSAVIKDNLIHIVGTKTISGNRYGFLLVVDFNGNIVFSYDDPNQSDYRSVGINQNQIFYTVTNLNNGSTSILNTKIKHYPSGTSYTLFNGSNFHPSNMTSIGNSIYICGSIGFWIGGTAAITKININLKNMYGVTTSSSPNGSITPTGTTTLNQGSAQSYTFTPNAGYLVDSVIVDGNKVDSIQGYTFSNISSNHSIRVTFKVDSNNVSMNFPTGISYQAIARDSAGKVLENKPIKLKFSIKENSMNGNTVYAETANLTTNKFGLFTCVIGNNNATYGNYKNIDWMGATKFLQVELEQGNSFVLLGTQQLLSVPYANAANKANTANQSNESKKIKNASLPVYPDNNAALQGGMQAGEMYRTNAGILMIVY